MIVKYWKRWWKLYFNRKTSHLVKKFSLFSAEENQSIGFAVLGSSFHHKQLQIKGFASFVVHLKKRKLELYRYGKIRRLHEHRIKLANFYFWQTKFSKCLINIDSIREKRHNLFKSLNFWERQSYSK